MPRPEVDETKQVQLVATPHLEELHHCMEMERIGEEAVGRLMKRAGRGTESQLG
jgi:hypothetical protein